MSNWLVGDWGGEVFEWLTNDDQDAISMLKRDHDAVKELFDQFEKAERKAGKRKIARQALEELRIHSALEEEIFYPAVRGQLNGGIMNEADEEHHIAKVLIAELDALKEDDDHYDAKFEVLAESVRHHIKEEEDEMLPKARDLAVDYQALGRKMEQRKRELKTRGLPPTAEDRLIQKEGRAAARPELRKKTRVSRMRKKAVARGSPKSRKKVAS